MTSTMTPADKPDAPADAKASLVARINRLEGQVRGIRRMVEEGRPWVETIQQIASLRSAAGAVALALLEAHLRGCVFDAVTSGQREDIAVQAAQAIRRYVRS
jgi:DNA-binding FrmR family transcriptional regulator